MAIRTVIRHSQYLWSSFMFRLQIILDYVIQTAGPVYIILAFALMSTVIYLFFTIILPAVGNVYSFKGIIHVMISSWLIFNIFFNYLFCIYTDPGAPPSSYDPGADLSKYESALPQIRWCKRCRKPKPPMTHHCHICKRCILKMDHHCQRGCTTALAFTTTDTSSYSVSLLGYLMLKPGQWARLQEIVQINSLHFCMSTASVVYMWAGCVYTALMASIPLFRSSMEPGKVNGVLFTFVLALAVLASLTCLLGWHLYLVLTADTTIDFYANRQRKREGRRMGQVWDNEFNMGKLQNFRNNFNLDGRSSWPWLLFPSRRPPKGDGTHFPTKQNVPDLYHFSNGGAQILHQRPNHATVGSSSRPSMTIQMALAEESMTESDMV